MCNRKKWSSLCKKPSSRRAVSGESKRLSGRFRASSPPASDIPAGKPPTLPIKDVCSDGTGHAEAVEVEYDPAQVSYEKLLDVFWENHDPTQLNRQGPDWGTQYRSAIFYTTPEQEKEANASKEKREKSGAYRKPIVTQIVPEARFYPAEDYHQQYLEKRGLASCHIK